MPFGHLLKQNRPSEHTKFVYSLGRFASRFHRVSVRYAEQRSLYQIRLYLKALFGADGW